MAGRPVVQALHGDDDGGGLALGPEPADVVAGNQAGELLDALAARGPMPTDGVRVLAGPPAGRRCPARRGTVPRRPGVANDIKPDLPRHGHTVPSKQAEDRHAANVIAEAP